MRFIDNILNIYRKINKIRNIIISYLMSEMKIEICAPYNNIEDFIDDINRKISHEEYNNIFVKIIENNIHITSLNNIRSFFSGKYFFYGTLSKNNYICIKGYFYQNRMFYLLLYYIIAFLLLFIIIAILAIVDIGLENINKNIVIIFICGWFLMFAFFKLLTMMRNALYKITRNRMLRLLKS